jgi:hypothetical protein
VSLASKSTAGTRLVRYRIRWDAPGQGLGTTVGGLSTRGGPIVVDVINKRECWAKSRRTVGGAHELVPAEVLARGLRGVPLPWGRPETRRARRPTRSTDATGGDTFASTILAMLACDAFNPDVLGECAPGRDETVGLCNRAFRKGPANGSLLSHLRRPCRGSRRIARDGKRSLTSLEPTTADCGIDSHDSDHFGGKKHVVLKRRL